jgi:hypothetical protein
MTYALRGRRALIPERNVGLGNIDLPTMCRLDVGGRHYKLP